MKTILFIETTKSGSSREAIKTAARLGYCTVLLTERNSFMEQYEEFPDVTRVIHVREITEDLIRTEIRRLQQQGNSIKAIISFVDPFVSMAAKLSNEYCDSIISVDALKKMEDKTATRKALKNNVTTPAFEIYQPTDELDTILNKGYTFPQIVKSAVSKASKDVYLVGNKVEMKKALKKIIKQYPVQKVVIEDYLDGPQYVVEVLVHNGTINIVAIFKQDITKKTKFIVTGYELQLNLEKGLYETLYKAVESILIDLGVTNATCHLEIRYVNGSWKLVEVNPRISGGAMNRMIEEAFGINLVEETIKLYLGYEPCLIRKYEKQIYAHYITINSYGNLLKVTGENLASHQPGVKEVYIKPSIGTIMIPPLSMGHRYGYVIASGNTSDEANENAVNAAKNIKFYLDPI
ncbi:ATP-grasp domain-containing protein [Sporosarcina limicola]|uniref:Biotin carboxylase n=1 Tax=Sporosarcina limicola TaxID=34101 RepID=A0A927MIQ0_9BACL|nr:ATP-grasp domain-containing protein [Sporosarcina limicola]MBE1553882.1 biotin carboxylase [Sporosarcina limicola]